MFSFISGYLIDYPNVKTVSDPAALGNILWVTNHEYNNPKVGLIIPGRDRNVNMNCCFCPKS